MEEQPTLKDGSENPSVENVASKENSPEFQGIPLNLIRLNSVISYKGKEYTVVERPSEENRYKFVLKPSDPAELTQRISGLSLKNLLDNKEASVVYPQKAIEQLKAGIPRAVNLFNKIMENTQVQNNLETAKKDWQTFAETFNPQFIRDNYAGSAEAEEVAEQFEAMIKELKSLIQLKFSNTQEAAAPEMEMPKTPVEPEAVKEEIDITIEDYIVGTSRLTDFGKQHARENAAETLEVARKSGRLAFKYLMGEISAREFLTTEPFSYNLEMATDEQIKEYADRESRGWRPALERNKKNLGEEKLKSILIEEEIDALRKQHGEEYAKLEQEKRQLRKELRELRRLIETLED